MRAIALLGGPKAQWPQALQENLLAAQKNGDLLFGVDRGALFLLELELKPDVAVGDFDSLKPKELQTLEAHVPDIRYSHPVKDWTDSELMLQAAFDDYAVDYLTIYGATGGRLDHFLVNLFTFLKPDFIPFAEKVTMIDRQNVIQYCGPGTHLVTKIEDFSYIGVVPLTPIQDLTIEGAKYQLSHFSCEYPISLASNEFLPGQPSFRVSCRQGMIALIYSRDEDRFANL